jgi:hypothetical protein
MEHPRRRQNMTDELCAFALKNTLNEVKNVCPELTNAFILGSNAQVIAKDDNTDEETATRAADTFSALAEKTEAIDGIEAIILQAATGHVKVDRVNGFYLTTVTTKEGDENYANALTRVAIPTVLKLAKRIHSAFPENINELTLKERDFPEETTNDTESYHGDAANETINAELVEQENETDTSLPEPPVTQFMIENLGGLRAHSDTVRIENALILQWKDLFGNKKIKEVDVETLDGQTTRCKFKPIKDSKHEGKGIIQMPMKTRMMLQTSKGELVMVKPVIE